MCHEVLFFLQKNFFSHFSRAMQKQISRLSLACGSQFGESWVCSLLFVDHPFHRIHWETEAQRQEVSSPDYSVGEPKSNPKSILFSCPCTMLTLPLQFWVLPLARPSSYLMDGHKSLLLSPTVLSSQFIFYPATGITFLKHKDDHFIPLFESFTKIRASQISTCTQIIWGSYWNWDSDLAGWRFCISDKLQNDPDVPGSNISWWEIRTESKAKRIGHSLS